MRRRSPAIGALILLIGLFTASPEKAYAQDARGFIAALGNQAIQVLGPGVPQAQRIARFRQIFQSDFDVPGIGQFVLGRYWRVATPEEQQEFLRLFQEYIVQSYAARLGEYGGEPFRVIGSRASGGETVVTSEIARPNGSRVLVDWYVIERGGAPRITDVYVGGVPAYSTLGYFNDPMLSTVIRYPDTEVARLIFHELAHQVAYAKDDTVFNESFAVAVEVAVLELDARSLRPLRDEADLDLARLREISLELPPRADVPGEDDPLGWLVGDDACPLVLAAVDAPVVDVTADLRLEHSFGDRRTEEVVLRWFEIAEPLGEHGEGPLDRRLHDDVPADHHGRCLGHEFSSVGCSTTS